MNFEEAFEKLIGHEGGYVNNPKDGGGETKYGISKRSYPDEDIKNLTLERARELYKRDYWVPAGCSSLPDVIRFDVFDMAVNSGVRRSIKTLQRAVFTVEDGLLGPKTILAATVMPAYQVIARFNAIRLVYMASLPNWPTFSRGWVMRIADNLLQERH
jgi:lysozyme family protein